MATRNALLDYILCLVLILPSCFAQITHGEQGSFYPVVLLHGMGDAADNPGMLLLKQRVQDVMPGETHLDAWLNAHVFVPALVTHICSQLRTIPELQFGFNAVSGLTAGCLVCAVGASLSRTMGHVPRPDR